MKWTRVRNGLYKAGPYTVISHDTHRPLWTATGPGLDENVYGTKTEAQETALAAAQARIIPDPYGVTPVIGDKVMTNDGRAGTVGSTMTASQVRQGEPLYCLRLARKKRLCLFRHEFQVVMP